MLHYIHEALNNSTAQPDTKAREFHAVMENVSSRRDFLKVVGVGGGLVVGLQLLPASTAQAFDPYPTGGLEMPNGIVNNPFS